MNPEDFDLLLEEHLDESLPEGKQKQLATALEEHEWAMDRFVERMTLVADLRARLGQGESLSKTESVSLKPVGLLTWALGCSAAALIAIGLFLFLRPPAIDSGIRIVAAEGVGTLNREALESGKEIQLHEGILELELNRESRVVLEAPATFQVLSSRHLFLSSGRCFAEMPKGKSGLRIETPAGEALDLGTKFAVEVSSANEMKVHVFDGAVEVSGGDARKRLTEGQGLTLTETGKSSSVSANSSLFVPRVPQALVKDTPYLHWPMDEGEGMIVRANGHDMDASPAQGSFVIDKSGQSGPLWIKGVKKTGLAFERDSWIKTGHDGVSGDQDRTVACWVKLPAEEQSTEVAPLIAWGYYKKKDSESLGKSWMLAVSPHKEKKRKEPYGVLRLGVRGQDTFGHTNLRDGKWHHVAAVAMSGTYGTSILLYVDGKLEKTRRGMVAEGLKTSTDPKEARPIMFGRHLWARELLLRGSLDEIYLFGDALSGDEIRQLMNLQPEE